MNYPYNRRFIKLIRKTLNLTQQEMSNKLGITVECFRTYESGRSRGSTFFHERMMEVFGIDLRQNPDLHKIVFSDPLKISAAAYRHLSTVEKRGND